MFRPRPALLAFAIAACAATGLAARAPRLTDEQRLEKLLSGLVPGKPVDCIPQTPTLDSQTFDGAILYRRGGTRYLNRFGGSCSIRSSFDILVVRTYGSQLCRGDIARIVESSASIERGSCVFDSFTPYTKPK